MEHEIEEFAPATKPGATAAQPGRPGSGSFDALVDKIAESERIYRRWAEEAKAVCGTADKIRASLADVSRGCRLMADRCEAAASSPPEGAGEERSQAWSEAYAEMGRVAAAAASDAEALCSRIAEEMGSACEGVASLASGRPGALRPAPPKPPAPDAGEEVSWRFDTRLFSFAAKRHARDRKKR